MGIYFSRSVFCCLLLVETFYTRVKTKTESIPVKCIQRNWNKNHSKIIILFKFDHEKSSEHLKKHNYVIDFDSLIHKFWKKNPLNMVNICLALYIYTGKHWLYIRTAEFINPWVLDNHTGSCWFTLDDYLSNHSHQIKSAWKIQQISFLI